MTSIELLNDVCNQTSERIEDQIMLVLFWKLTTGFDGFAIGRTIRLVNPSSLHHEFREGAVVELMCEEIW